MVGVATIRQKKKAAEMNINRQHREVIRRLVSVQLFLFEGGGYGI